jgi:hypothetical protein
MSRLEADSRSSMKPPSISQSNTFENISIWLKNTCPHSVQCAVASPCTGTRRGGKSEHGTYSTRSASLYPLVGLDLGNLQRHQAQSGFWLVTDGEKVTTGTDCRE